MSQNQGIIDYLKKEYGAKAIFLYGSNASDNATPVSDFDVTVLSTTDKPGGREIMDDSYLDITVINGLPEDYILRSAYAPYQPLKAIYDETGESQKVLEATEKAYKQGPAPLSDLQLSNRNIRLKKIIEKLEFIEQEELVFYHVGMAFSDMLVRYWFEVNQRWPQPPYQALKTIQDEDGDYATLLIRVTETANSAKQVKPVLDAIYGKLFS